MRCGHPRQKLNRCTQSLPLHNCYDLQYSYLGWLCFHKKFVSPKNARSTAPYLSLLLSSGSHAANSEQIEHIWVGNSYTSTEFLFTVMKRFWKQWSWLIQFCEFNQCCELHIQKCSNSCYINRYVLKSTSSSGHSRKDTSIRNNKSWKRTCLDGNLPGTNCPINTYYRNKDTYEEGQAAWKTIILITYCTLTINISIFLRLKKAPAGFFLSLCVRICICKSIERYQW